MTSFCSAPQRKKSKPAPPVAGDVALVSTGPFAALDAELTLRIMQCLSIKDKLVCVSEVCKGWRSLRRSAVLWRSLNLTSAVFSAAGLVDFVTGARSPLPSAACVESLTLDGAKKFDAKSFKTVLKALTSATDVTLSGKKLSKDAVSFLAKPRAAPLRSLKLSKVGDGEAAVLDILGASPQLETLAIDCAVTEQWVGAAGARAAAARGGGVPLLSKLAVGEWLGGWQSGVHASAFGRLGVAFPELAELTFEALIPQPSSALGTWAPMPALRSLTINGVGSAFGSRAITDAFLQDFMKRLAAAAPGLRSLNFGRGSEYISHNEIKAGRKFAALPKICGPDMSGIGALQQLKELEFQSVHLEASDALGAHLPNLRRLVLRNCGPHAAAAVAAIAGNAPRLSSVLLAGLVRTDLDGTSGPGATGLANLASASLTELQIDTSFSRDYMYERSMFVKEKAADIATELRGLAQRQALPALRALVVDLHLGTPCPSLFVATAPWPVLERVELKGMTEDSAAAMLASLRAPALRFITMPGVVANYALTAPAGSSFPVATVAVCDAYEKLRADGHCPLLPKLLRREAGRPPPPPTEGEAEEEEGAGAGRDD